MSSGLRIPSWKGIRYRARAAAYHCNALAGHFRRPIWIMGDGRSGTTWLGDLINYTGRARLLFEPFHPVAEEGMKRFAAVPYVRPGASSPDLEAYVRHVFSGRFLSYWTEDHSSGWWYDGLIVKTTFANLFAGWAASHLPNVPKVLIVRHPCAVAESKTGLDSMWVVEPMKFWNQKDLREDYLQPYEATIRETTDPFLKYVVCWAIEHAVLLPQAVDAGIHVIHYEHLCTDPEAELAALYQHLSLDVDVATDSRVQSIFKAPSKTSRKGGDVLADQRTTKWMGRVDKQQVHRAVEILETFGLAHVYNDGALPLDWR